MLAPLLGRNVRELLETTDARELAEWRIIARHHPFGSSQDDARTALICSTLANCHRGRGQRPYTTKDFMPDYVPRKEEGGGLRKNFLNFCAAKGIKVKKA